MKRFTFLTFTLCTFVINNYLFGQQCPKPDNLSASSIGDNTATLSWNAAAAHESYELTIMHGQGTPQYRSVINLTETTHTISDLSAGSNYRFRVKASCSKGKGNSSWYDFKTTGDEPVDSIVTKPGPCPKVTNMAVREVTDTTVNLTWYTHEKHVNYQVDVKSKNHTTSFRLTEETLDSFLVVEGLEPGGNYHFRVKAECDKNKAGSSKWIDFTTTGNIDSTSKKCAKPLNMSIIAVTDSSAHIEWVHPDSNATFVIDIKSGSQTPSYSLSETTSFTNYLAGGLTSGGNYQTRVKAFCSDSSSSGSSDWAAFTTLAKTDTTSSDTTSTDSLVAATATEQLSILSNEKTASVPDPVLLQEIPAPSLKAFPNPVQSELFLEIPPANLRPVTHIKINDMAGKVVFHKKYKNLLPGAPLRIPMDKLDQGYYQITLKSGDHIAKVMVFKS